MTFYRLVLVAHQQSKAQIAFEFFSRLCVLHSDTLNINIVLTTVSNACLFRTVYSTVKLKDTKESDYMISFWVQPLGWLREKKIIEQQ